MTTLLHADPDEKYDSGEMEHVRRELEWVNPDYLMRGRLLALRKELAAHALALLDLLSPLSAEPVAPPRLQADPRREDLLRNAESAVANAAFWLKSLREDFAKVKP